MTGVSVRYSAFGAMAVSVDGDRGAAHPAPRARRPVRAARRPRRPGRRRAAGRRGLGRRGARADARPRCRSRSRGCARSSSPDRTARKGSRLVSTAAGYSLVAEAADVDTWTLRVAGRAGPGGRRRRRSGCALSDEARALWTASPYADCDAPRRAQRDRPARGAAAHRARSCGPGPCSTSVDRTRRCAALAELAPQHPYRERLWSLLALAQYQCSRQADALETLRRLRERLADELGVDPSEEIQRLEQAVLRQDPSLTAADGGSRARSAAGERRPRGRDRRPTGTVGREQVLDAGARRCSTRPARRARPRFLLVAGEPGIGKSRLVADLGEAALARGHAGAGRSLPRGRLRPGAVAVAGRRAGAGSEGRGGRPAAGAPARGRGRRHAGRGRAPGCGCSTPSSTCSRGRPRAARCCWSSRTSTGPTPPRSSCSATSPTSGVPSPVAVRVHAAYDRGADRARPWWTRWRRWPGPAPSGCGSTGSTTASVGALLTASVGEHDPQLGRVRRRRHRRQPVLRAAVRPPARRRTRPRARRPRRRCRCPTASATCCASGSGGCREAVVRTLTSAAVLGRHIDPDLVAELAGVPVDDCLDLLDLAMTSGLVEEHDAGYAFVHALARESLYAELSAARRMRLHDRAGRIIEARTGPRRRRERRDRAPRPPGRPARAPSTPSAPARGWRGPRPGGRRPGTPTPRRWSCGGRSRPTPRPDSATTIEAKCGAAAALLRLARTVEARDAGRGGGPDRAPRSAAGTWSRTRPPSTTAPGCGPGASTACRTTTFIAVLTEATRHVSDPERARLLAALQMEHFYGWDSAVADPIGAESVEVARACGDRDLLRRGADGARSSPPGDR